MTEQERIKQREANRKSYYKNWEYYQQKHKQWKIDNKEKDAIWRRKYHAERMENDPAYREQMRQKAKRHYLNQQEKIKDYQKTLRGPAYVAHKTIANAIRNGQIARPTSCPECGSTEKISGHHVDYTKPLTVIWLCHKCHMKLNRDSIIINNLC